MYLPPVQGKEAFCVTSTHWLRAEEQRKAQPCAVPGLMVKDSYGIQPAEAEGLVCCYF